MPGEFLGAFSYADGHGLPNPSVLPLIVILAILLIVIIIIAIQLIVIIIAIQLIVIIAILISLEARDNSHSKPTPSHMV